MKTKNLLIFCSYDNIHAYNLCKIISQYKKFKVKIIIFPKKISFKKYSKIKKLFGKNVITFKENFPTATKKFIKLINDLKIDTGINTCWPYRVRKSFINLFDYGIINFHPSPLPINKGCHSSFWGIYLNKNHGCTMHLMDSNFDNGAILDQIVYKNNNEILANTVWSKSHSLAIDLLKKNLNKIYLKNFEIRKNGIGNYNKKTKIQNVTTLKIKDTIKISELWKIIRGVSFGDNGFYILVNKKKYKIVPKVKSC